MHADLEKEKATDAELEALKGELDEAQLPAILKKAKIDWCDLEIEKRRPRRGTSMSPPGP